MTRRRVVHRGKRRSQGGRGEAAAPARRPRQQFRSQLEEIVLATLHGAGTPMSVKELMDGAGLGRGKRQELLGALEALCQEKLVRCRRESYALKSGAELFSGTIVVNPKGFGFVSPTAAPPELEIDQDVFVPPGQLGGAAHGDTVLVLLSGRREGRFEGRVVAVTSRVTTQLVGIYRASGGRGLVVPEDSRFPYNLLIRREDSRGAKNGEAVLAQVTSFASGQRNLDGVVLEVLGNPEDLAVQTEMVIRKFELPHVFDNEVIRQVEGLDPRVAPATGRSDLRGIAHVTIDGETARDFDDAVAIEELPGGGHRLYVSIADVSHYVRPDTPVDLEAYQRGTSVYFPTAVVPMLPERLSNNLCSLVPHEDRYTFTAILDFDPSGKRTGKRFMKSVINSRHRLTYTVVWRILQGDAAARAEYQDMVVDLERMAALAAQLEKKRMKRGSIGFEIPEPLVVLGEDGNSVANVVRSERNQAHKLIEEFMLAANEAVAETLAHGKVDSLYRIHEPPDVLKVASFTEFAQSMGLDVDDEGAGSPAWFGRVLALVAGTAQEYIVSNLLLRTMQQARYSPHNVGHFGLAATHYTHFTSPIRRYPDLMVHRALAASLAGKGAASGGQDAPAASTEEAGTFLSKRERTAVDAEREMVERLQVRFMASRIGESFEAVVSGATSFGLFVELTEVFVSGAVAITDLTDDYYTLEENRHRLIGKRTNTVFQIGDLIGVRLLSVDESRRRINFAVERKPSRKGAGRP
ncbi:MAG: ribonuclease R [Thermodesulfobacteriota bacterium]